jgi:GNAT superfamily N-acetyltransferase
MNKPPRPSLKQRRAVMSDAEAIRTLTRTVYAKWIPTIGREPFPMTADYHAAVEKHWIELCEVDGNLVGLIEMIPQPDHLFIENLAVAEEAQRQGIGQLLLARAEQVARETGRLELQLATNAAFASNLKFYEHRGFIVLGTKTLFDGGKMVRFRKPLSHLG